MPRYCPVGCIKVVPPQFYKAAAFTDTMSMLDRGNADNYFTVPIGLSPFDIDVPLSISFWFKIDSAFAGAVTHLIVSNGNPSNQIQIINTTGSGVFFEISIGPNNSQKCQMGTSGVDYRDDLWHHCVYTAALNHNTDNGNMKIYVDAVDVGVSVRNMIVGSSFSQAPGTTQVNRSAGVVAADTVFIDRMAIFDYELTPAQVTTIYNSGCPDDLTDFTPVNNWPFEGTADDIGSRAETPTITGTIEYSTDIPCP